MLLGPRQTGKSTHISNLNPDLTINLADESTYLNFASNPRAIRQILSPKVKTVFLDEVQRLASILNTVQALLDEKKGQLRFFLTGSSARKLRRGQANLLPGRIHSYFLGPLCACELHYKVNTTLALEVGTLPGIYLDDSVEDRQKMLTTYATTYLKEEVQAEGLTRNLEGFARFLKFCAASSGRFLDFAKLAVEAQVPRQSAVRYFEILEDTLVVSRCESFARSEIKRLVRHPKYYFFDNGVLNGILNNFRASQERMGLLFEHLIYVQIQNSAKAADQEIRVSTFRTEHGAEVDFIVEFGDKIFAIEAKASRNIGPSDFRGLHIFGEFLKKPCKKWIIYLGDQRRRIQDVEILPWQDALKEMRL